jgi:hypothetical protein
MKKVVMDEQDAKRLKDLAQYLKTRHHDWLWKPGEDDFVQWPVPRVGQVKTKLHQLRLWYLENVRRTFNLRWNDFSINMKELNEELWPFEHESGRGLEIDDIDDIDDKVDHLIHRVELQMGLSRLLDIIEKIRSTRKATATDEVNEFFVVMQVERRLSQKGLVESVQMYSLKTIIDSYPLLSLGESVEL